MKQNLSFCFLVVIFQHQHIFLAAYKKRKETMTTSKYQSL